MSGGIFLGGYRTLKLIIDCSRTLKVLCTECRGDHTFTQDEIIALAEKVGLDFCVVNRRCRCRLTPGCTGWNRFYGMFGVFHPLWDDERAVIWMERKWRPTSPDSPGASPPSDRTGTAARQQR